MKQKQQELEREQITGAMNELNRLEQDDSYRDALNRLDAFCQERGRATGSLEQYRINLRAIEGWDRVIAAWDKITETDPAKATDMRISEAKRLQDEDPDKEFGDINLFVSWPKRSMNQYGDATGKRLSPSSRPT